jgi:cold-inducible RNA-binding protein
MTSIYVGNLAFTTTEDELRQAFSQHGAVSEVNIIKDRETGRPRGFAFIEMPNNNEAATAIQELNLKEVGGRSITVNEARPKTDRPRGGGGGGRGGRGGGGGGGRRGGW